MTQKKQTQKIQNIIHYPTSISYCFCIICESEDPAYKKLVIINIIVQWYCQQKLFINIETHTTISYAVLSLYNFTLYINGLWSNLTNQAKASLCFTAISQVQLSQLVPTAFFLDLMWKKS